MSITQTVFSFFKNLQEVRDSFFKSCRLISSDFDDCYGREINELENFIGGMFLKDISKESPEFFELQKNRSRLLSLSLAKGIIFRMCDNIFKQVFLGSRICEVMALQESNFTGSYPNLDSLKNEAKVVYDFCCKYGLSFKVSDLGVNRNVRYVLFVKF